MGQSVGNKAVKGVVWVSIDKFTTMGLQFIVNLVLARLLVPEDFGIVGLLALFTAVSQTLIDGGFGNALIQKKEPNQVDYSTIFYWNLAVSATLYLILFFSAPIIARFFNQPLLVGVTRTVSLSLIFGALTTIQTNRLRKQLAFRTLAIVNVCSYAIAGGCAIGMAKSGFGVYAIVGLILISSVMQILILWLLTRWHPSACFSRSSFKALFGFGGYLLGANLLQVICVNLQSVVIGRKYSSTQLGLYSQAYKLDNIMDYTIPQILIQVMYPVYSSAQDDDNKLHNILAMNMRVIAFGIFPIMAMLIILAHPIITGLYGPKWIDAVPYFQILCCGGFFVCLQNITFYAVAAKGCSRVLFLWSIEKWSILLALIFTGMNFGMDILLWCMMLSHVNIFFVNSFLASKYVGFKMRRQMTLLAPIALLTVASASLTLLLRNCVADAHPLILFAAFATTYLGLSAAFRLKAFTDMIDTLKMLLKRKTFNPQK